MDVNIKKWIVMESVRNFANSISTFFVSIYIWQNNNNLQSVLLYHLALFAGIPVFGLIGIYVSKKIGSKLTLLVSNIFQCLTIFSVLRFSDLLFTKPYLFGFLISIAIGLYSVTRNAVFSKLMANFKLSEVTAKLKSISALIGLLIPLIGAIWIYVSRSYNGIFILALVFYLITTFITFKINFANEQRSKGDFVQTLTQPDFLKLLKYFFLQGIKSGITWSVFGILILSFVNNNLPIWGTVNFSLGIIGITGGMIYSRYFAKNKNIFIFMLANLMVAASVVIFLGNYNLWSLIVFLVINELSDSFLISSSSPIISGIISESGEANLYEKYWLTEIPLSVGRMLPISILFFSSANLDYTPVIGLVFMVLGFVPIISSGVLRSTQWVATYINN